MLVKNLRGEVGLILIWTDRLARMSADRDALEVEKLELKEQADGMRNEMERLRDLSERPHESLKVGIQ